MVRNLQSQLTQLRKLENKKARTKSSSAAVITSSHNSDNHEYLQEVLEYKSASRDAEYSDDFLSNS